MPAGEWGDLRESQALLAQVRRSLRPQYARICVSCGSAYIAHTTKGRWCSKACYLRMYKHQPHYAAQHRQYEATQRRAQDIPARWPRTSVGPSAHTVHCAGCGRDVIQRRPNMQACSAACRARLNYAAWVRRGGRRHPRPT